MNFLHKWRRGLRIRQIEFINSFHLSWKSLKRNFKPLFVTGGNITDYT